MKKIKERLRRSLYELFKEEINKFVGVVDHIRLPPIEVIRTDKQSTRLTFAVQIDEREFSSGFGDTISQKIERAKKVMADEIVNGNFIKIDTVPLISSEFYGRREIRGEIQLVK